MVLFLFLSGISITDKQLQRYVKQFYGPKFSVDLKSYPKFVSNSYLNLVLDVETPKHIKGKHYPEKTWLAIIHTIPSKIDHIVTTKKTWCQEKYQKHYGFKCIFVLVDSTVEESGKKQDLLRMNETSHDIYFVRMPDLKEGWFTLQQKNIATYIMIMNLFPDYKFYSRVDDQIVVTLDMFIDFLVEHSFERTVVGDYCGGSPRRDKNSKYYDPLAYYYPYRYYYPSGFLSTFSNDIIKYFAQWKNYYNFAPSSLEDPGFGNWLYKYSKEIGKKINYYVPKDFGGYEHYGHNMVIHNVWGETDQVDFFERKLRDGYMKMD